MIGYFAYNLDVKYKFHLNNEIYYDVYIFSEF